MLQINTVTNRFLWESLWGAESFWREGGGGRIQPWVTFGETRHLYTGMAMVSSRHQRNAGELFTRDMPERNVTRDIHPPYPCGVRKRDNATTRDARHLIHGEAEMYLE